MSTERVPGLKQPGFDGGFVGSCAVDRLDREKQPRVGSDDGRECASRLNRPRLRAGVRLERDAARAFLDRRPAAVRQHLWRPVIVYRDEWRCAFVPLRDDDQVQQRGDRTNRLDAVVRHDDRRKAERADRREIPFPGGAIRRAVSDGDGEDRRRLREHQRQRQGEHGPF